VTFQGGEPLVHPNLESLVSAATSADIQCGLITNGWFLGQRIEALVAAGLSRLSISLDSDNMLKHELNRGLRGLQRRIEEGIRKARALGLRPVACVTINRLVDYDALPSTLEKLGFEAVSFSYPRREPFGSSSLVYSQESQLLDQRPEELLAALGAIKRLKKRFRVVNPSVALDEVAHFVKGEEQDVPCIGGHKYFYLDWNLDIWRCEAWTEPLGSVFELDSIPDQREHCQQCTMACYRHASVLMHGPIALADSFQALARGDIKSAVRSLRQRGVARSLRALVAEQWPRLAMSAAQRPRPHG
jgi:MoaA/NifB/PqqE/SkfB family radical SAM enzyme